MTTTPITDPWVRRVQALLAKAESTTFPAEAEALLAKAQELIARHSIDDALLARAAGASGDAITIETVVIGPPYAGPRSMLLSAVAGANHCRVILQGTGGNQRCVVVGHRSDIDAVATLFAALSLHATRAMLQAIPPGGRVRAFRHAFLLAFGVRIGERLRAAADRARAEAEQQDGHSVALALVDRSNAVDAAVAAQFPSLRTVRSQASSGAGIESGREAANRAPLGQAAISGTRPSLPAS